MKESFYKGSIGSLKEILEDRGRTESFERGYHNSALEIYGGYRFCE